MKSKAILLVYKIAMAMVTVTVFSTAANAATYKVLHNFKANAIDGVSPQGGLIIDQAGSLYGTTSAGGARDGGGTVFELTPKEDGFWTETVLHSFGHGVDGANPWAALIFDVEGNLYGTTFQGGAGNLGTVFKLAPEDGGKWMETVLHSFKGDADGIYPLSSLFFDSAGNLYGTTNEGGGVWDTGTVFEIDTHGEEKVLHTFSQNVDGAYPVGGLIVDAAGNLYGTTADGAGSVFKLTHHPGAEWAEAVLFTFNGPDGGTSQSGLIFDAAGNLYGTTSFGGKYGSGVVFELSPEQGGGWAEEVLHNSHSKATGGALPIGNLIFDQKGNLYGTTEEGGAYGKGRAFELTPDGFGAWEFTTLHDFGNDTDGYYPYSGMVMDAAGNLYGTTGAGGTHSGGTVFEIIP